MNEIQKKANKKEKNLKLNIIFNGLYQFFVLIVPFITSPYVSRVLLPTGVGSYSVALSWVTYFSTFAAFGFLEYGTMILAKHRNNRKESSQLFYEIIFGKCVFTLIIFALYVILVLSNVFSSPSYPQNSKLVYLLLGFNILVNAFDASFLFQGFEEFGKLCLRNFIVRLLNMILIFVLVRNSNDYISYIAIMGGSNILLGLFSFIGIHKNVDKPKWSNPHLFHHLKEAFIYFIPTASIIFFPIISKTFISLFVRDAIQSGYYEQADKLITLIVTMINSVDAIMMSRMSYLYAIGDKKQIKEKTKKSLKFYLLLALPAFFGVLIINPYFTTGFFGAKYQESVNLVYFLSAKVLFAPLTALLGAIYYIPSGQIGKRNIFYLIGLGLNILLNFLLTYFKGTAGASIASTLTEFVLVIIFVMFAKKNIHLFSLTKETFVRVLDGALLMFISCYFATSFLKNRTSNIIVSILTILMGIVIYIIFLLLSKEETITFYFKLYIRKVKISLSKLNKH